MCKRKHFAEDVTKTQNVRKKSHAKRDTLKTEKDTSREIVYKKYSAYKHQSIFVVQDQCNIEDKVTFLENMVQELSLKPNIEEEPKV